MYIEPQTNIKILSNCPIDIKFENTLWFNNVTDQYNYFNTLVKYNLTNYTYQRVNRGVARIGIQAENLYDCNYMMFQNTAFGNKWFYAFIEKVEYVNNSMSEITFTIDPIQTWLKDFTINQCFVEREHIIDDTIGNNIVPEPVQLSEYIVSSYDELYYLRDHAVIVATVDSYNQISGQTYQGVFSGASLRVFRSDDVVGINNYLNGFIQQPDSIISIYTLPKRFIPIFRTSDIPNDGTPLVIDIVDDDGVLLNATPIYGNELFEGYRPKNKKLYTYPYNFFSVDNNNGQSMELRYEFFLNHMPRFKFYATYLQPVAGKLIPVGYKGLTDLVSTYNKESLSLSNFPLCSWGVDSYQAWISQNRVPIMIGAGSKTIQNLITAPLSPLSSITSSLNMVTDVMQKNYTASIQADIIKGSTDSGNVNYMYKKQTYYGGRMHITGDCARIIDEYFTKYGYATNHVKHPNTHSRPHWNYVKTVGATIKGLLPSDDQRKICDILDNGITFWKNGDEVGNYSLNNSI